MKINKVLHSRKNYNKKALQIGAQIGVQEKQRTMQHLEYRTSNQSVGRPTIEAKIEVQNDIPLKLKLRHRTTYD